MQQVRRKAIREKAKITKSNKSYEDYDWVNLYRNGQIGKLYATELNKYLSHHKLEGQLNLKKQEKLKWVEAHIGKQLYKDLQNNRDYDEVLNEDIAEFSDESDGSDEVVDDSDNNEEDQEAIESAQPVSQIITRHGRRTRSTLISRSADLCHLGILYSMCNT